MTTTNTTPDYIIKTSAACMPASCWGRYKRIAVLEVEPGVTEVSMISDRAKGVRRVVETWERLHYGTSDRDAYSRARREAEALVAELKASREATA